jgi:hypothetical protein
MERVDHLARLTRSGGSLAATASADHFSKGAALQTQLAAELLGESTRSVAGAVMRTGAAGLFALGGLSVILSSGFAVAGAIDAIN